MGFIAFIVVMATLSAFFEAIDSMSEMAPIIAVLLAAVAGYRFVKQQMARRKEAREEADREELKEELREEIREEMRRQHPEPMRSTAETTEEPYYPEVKYFRQ